MSNPHLFHIYTSSFRRHYNVTDANKTPRYYVDNSTWTPEKPDLTVHAGSEKKAPVVAVSKFKHFSRHCKIGLGDPGDVNNVQWEDLIGQGLSHGKFRWQMPTRNKIAFSRQPFIWKRTAHVGVGRSSPSVFSSDNVKLVDEQTEQMLAVYTSSSHKSVDKAGKLEVYADYGQDFDVMVLVTALTIIEKHRRSSSAGGGGGGGGGGGC